MPVSEVVLPVVQWLAILPRPSMMPIQYSTGSPFMQMKAPAAKVRSQVPASALRHFVFGQ